MSAARRLRNQRYIVVEAPMFSVFFRRTVRRFVRAEEGNIAVIFGIAIIPILAAVGAAIDYARAATARTQMQNALDSTALMLSRDLSSGVIAASDIPTKGPAYFSALY